MVNERKSRGRGEIETIIIDVRDNSDRVNTDTFGWDEQFPSFESSTAPERKRRIEA